MEEIWKDIIDFDNYQVSNLGRVKRKSCIIIYKSGMKCNYPEKILKPDTDRGYKRATLCKNNKITKFSIHRLVAIHFIENPLKKLCVNHIDGNPSNNSVENLEWCTYSENERHSYDVLGKINSNRKLSEDALNDIRENAIKFVNIKEFAQKHSVDRSTILNILNKRYYV